MRRIEGVKVKDLRQKFPDLKNTALPSLDHVMKKLRPVRAGKGMKRYARSAAFICKTSGRSFSQPRQRIAPFRLSLRNSQSVYLPPIQPLPRVAYQPSYEGKKKQLQNAARPIFRRRKRKKIDENKLSKPSFNHLEIERALLLEWAWHNARWDILRDCGIILPPETFEP